MFAIIFFIFSSYIFAYEDPGSIYAPNPPKSITRDLPQSLEAIKKTNKAVGALERGEFDENTFSDEEIDNIDNLTNLMLKKLESESQILDKYEEAYLADLGSKLKPMSYMDFINNMNSIIEGSPISQNPVTPYLPNEMPEDTEQTLSDNKFDSSGVMDMDLNTDSENNNLKADSSDSKESLEVDYNVDYEYDDILPQQIPLFEAISKRYFLRLNQLVDDSVSSIEDDTE